MIKPKLTVAVLITALFGAIILTLAVITPQSAFAAVGSGGSGGGGGGSGGPYTRYGFGWYRFSVGGPGPRDFQNGGNWASVSSACSGYRHVMAFIVQRASGGPTNARVYDDTWNWNWRNYEGYRGYLGNSGGNWVSRSTAWNMFWSLPASERAGYTIGTNVGWFCYEAASSFTTTGTTTADRTTVYPGETIRWTHILRNNGPTTSSPIRSQTVNSGFSNSSFNGTRNITTATIGSGVTRGHGSYAIYTATNADVGNSLCQQLQWDPTNSSGGRDGRANNVCVNVIPRPWTTAATSTRTVNGANVSTGSPGNVIRWTHTLTLHTNQNHSAIRSQTYSTGFSNGWNGLANITHTAAWRSVGVIRTINPSAANRTQYTIAQVDVGNTLCQQFQWDPTNSSGGRDGRTSNLCVNVPFNYNLVPAITNIPTNSVIDSDNRPVSVIGRVLNNGPTKSQPNIAWQITQVKYGPTVSTIPNQGGGTGAAPCSFFTGYISGSCNASGIANGTQASGYGYGTVGTGNPASSQTYNATGQLTDDAPGTKICYVMSVRPYSQASSNWRHSQLYCLIVGKQPKVQVHGSNIQVGRSFGGSINSSATVEGDRITKAAGGSFGSWAEYGIFAPSDITLVASGSGLNVPTTGHPSSTQRSWSAYSFTKRTTGADAYGGYSYGNSSLPNITTVFPRPPATPTLVPAGTNLTVNSLPKGANVRPNTTQRNVTVNASSNPALTSGQWVVINAVQHNVTITSNIEYANGPFTNASQIPQLVIIADNITIAAGVTRVDAWLIAKNDPSRTGAYGAIATCDQQSGSSGSNGMAQWLATPNGSGTNYTASNNSRLTISHCTSQLRINGPVIANKLYLRRTAGSGPAADSGTPAEIISLRPDAYLWAREHMSPGLMYQVKTEKELPPRY